MEMRSVIIFGALKTKNISKVYQKNIIVSVIFQVLDMDSDISAYETEVHPTPSYIASTAGDCNLVHLPTWSHVAKLYDDLECRVIATV